MVNLKDNLFKINQIEKNFDTKKYISHGFNFWPLLRAKIYFEEMHRTHSNEKRKKLSIINIIKEIFLNFRINKYKSNKHKKFIFIFDEDSEDLVLDFSSRFADQNSLVNYVFISKMEKKISNGMDRLNINNFTSTYWLFRIKMKLIRMFKRKNIISKLGYKITDEVFTIDYLSSFYERLFRRLSPQYVINVCFYSIDGFALNLACKKLHIKSIDYQHGAQNDFHNMYTNWSDPPEKGYEILPDIFWTWGLISKDRLNAWTVFTKGHKAIVGGNSSYIIKKNQNLLFQKGTLNNKKKLPIILVSLQNEKFLPNWLLIYAMNTKNCVHWIFRPHPRNQLSKSAIYKIEKASWIKLDIAGQYKKDELFSMADVHITGYSSMAFEAQLYKLRTIFIHENALQGYSKIIDEIRLFYAPSAIELDDKLQKILKSDVPIFNDDYHGNENDIEFDKLDSFNF